MDRALIKNLFKLRKFSKKDRDKNYSKLWEYRMKVASQHNLVRCEVCDAIYDKTAKWVRGYSRGTSNEFTTTGTVKEKSCPVCGKERE